MDLEPNIKQPKVVQSQNNIDNTELKPPSEQTTPVISYHQVGLSTFHQSAHVLSSSLSKSVSKPVVCVSKSSFVPSPVVPDSNCTTQSASVKMMPLLSKSISKPIMCASKSSVVPSSVVPSPVVPDSNCSTQSASVTMTPSLSKSISKPVMCASKPSVVPSPVVPDSKCLS